MGLLDIFRTEKAILKRDDEWAFIGSHTETEKCRETDAGTIYERRTVYTYRHIESGEKRFIRTDREYDTRYKKWVEFDNGDESVLDSNRSSGRF